MTFVSYAQNFEDVLLWRALRSVKCGFYIDVGAAHPDIDSITRAFYDRGWSGLNVEPTDEYFMRLSAARPRDTNLQIVLGEQRGHAELLVVEGTGLSTLDAEAGASLAKAGWAGSPRICPMDTLAELCARHAPPVIHFLKIDVEGAERAVLAGADFTRYRPWVAVVEATAPMSTVPSHADWEPALLRAGYRFVWFDGLNRFYIAEEQANALAPHFRTPPNVFDDFVRAADSEFARRIGDAERRAMALADRATAAEAQASAANASAAGATAALQALQAAAMHEHQQLRAAWSASKAEFEAWMDAVAARLRDGEAQRDAAVGWVDAMFDSTSWRWTAPLRRLRAGAETRRPRFAILPALPAPPTFAAPAAREAPPPVPVHRASRGRHLRTIHQFHSGSAVGDAITNAMLLMRGVLRRLGYRSEIFVEHRDQRLADEIRLIEELPSHDRYVLIVRHSMGFDAFDRITALRASKVLLYHNITPPEFLAGNAFMQRYARLGREQLALWRGGVAASLADSEYNALELRTLGFDAVQICTMLFDVDRLMLCVAAAPAPLRDRPFTLLFVGRVCVSKGQRELVDAYAAFHARFGKPSRLVLVGRHDGDEDPYVQEIRSRAAMGCVSDAVLLTGLVSDEELHAYYASADIFVCLSLHEGFCVPIVEAMAHRVPVVARPAGAVAYTLGDGEGLLTDDAPDAVAARLFELASDSGLRDALRRRQSAALERFGTDRQVPKLVQALCCAGAAPPVEPASRRMLSDNMRFAIAGHVNGSYSLAAVNRLVALHLEAEHPGRVRFLPVECQPIADLDGVPASMRRKIRDLAARRRPGTGPEMLISQHYPVHVPEQRSDLNVALFFWEESDVPPETVALIAGSFDAVLAPSRFVAKALIDSGVSIPVRVAGISVDLHSFSELAAARRPRGDAGITFLNVSSGFPRKGVDILLRAYARAFRRGDEVRLVIKSFPNPHNDVAAQLALLRDTDVDLADIELIDADIDEADLLSLYGQADVMVLPTRGEGLNLPALEAMAAGLPIIVTGYGGHMDFCGDGRARLIDFSFAASRTHLAGVQSVWIEPDEDDLVAALREAYARRHAPIRAPLADTARRSWADLAAELLTAPPREPIDIVWISSWGVRCGIAEYSRHMIEAFPTSAAIGSITVFCDDRFEPGVPTPGEVRVLPCWPLGLDGRACDIARAVAAEDPRIVVIQHQPGLIKWAELARLLGSFALRERLVVVTLHTTSRLFDADAEDREAVLAALAGVARVVVHTIHDLNRLKVLGLTENVVLFAQGVADGPSAAPAPRPLPRGSAPTIGCYGFFLPDKGIPQLIDAVSLLRNTYPDIRLRLVNADYGSPESRGEIAACRAIARKLGVAEAIEWHTTFLPHEESRRLLTECDVIALPYQASKEGSSAALRSALGAGVSVMVTPLPLFDEAADAVHRAPGFDAAALADKLGHLLVDTRMRGELQQAAEVWCKQRAWRIVAARMQGMLLGLAASGSALP